MSSTPREVPQGAKSWQTLLVLLAAPLALSAILIVAWFAGGRRPLGGTATGEIVVATLMPLSMTWSTLSQLQKPSTRSLVLPTPCMMWLVFMSQRNTELSWYSVAFAHVTLLLLLGACWRGNRRIATAAVICCGAVALWLQLAGIVHT